MAVYQPGIPTGTVNLDVDYLSIQGNFQQANVVYGTDHYPFDNATPNQGFHNVVTTPPVVNNPPDGLPPATGAGILKIYAYQQYGALGPLHYSRGPNNAVPTALTKLNSSSSPIVLAPAATTNVLDFTGMTFGICTIYATDLTSPTTAKIQALVIWNGSSISINVLTSGVNLLVAQAAGNILQLRNNGGVALNNVYWTLEVIRIE